MKILKNWIFLEETIEHIEAAINYSMDGSPDQGTYLQILLRLLAWRFQHTKKLEDMQKTEEAAEMAVSAPVWEGRNPQWSADRA